jgi:OCT family organic cation transporter-like MFS transporter 4/5
MGGIGAIIAPGIVVLGHLNASLPLAIFGAVAIMGGLLAMWLPETLNQPLYETLEGLERGEVAI